MKSRYYKHLLVLLLVFSIVQYPLSSLAFAISSSSGGIITTYTTGTAAAPVYKVHRFTSSGTLTLTGTATSFNYLIVGGGGGGGNSNIYASETHYSGGGGGAGGLLTGTVSLGAGSYSVVVGAGGAGGTAATTKAGTNGGNSSFAGTSVLGGGGGGGYFYNGGASTTYPPTIGGSGGGGGAQANAVTTPNGAAGTAFQGYAGGTGVFSSTDGTVQAAAGGGGRGGAGQNGAPSAAGAGGAGVFSTITGSSVQYAGGGGGGKRRETGTAGTASFGGGSGGGGSSLQIAQNGTANTGGGGGGAGYNSDAGGAGGSGVVIARYIMDYIPTSNAGADQTVASAAAVTLNGTASSDLDAGDTLTYSWSQTGGTAVTLSNTTAASPSFTAPTLAAGAASQNLTFSLVITDSYGYSAPADSVTVTVVAPPLVTLVKSVSSVTTANGANPSVVDAGDVMNYQYQITNNGSVTITGLKPTDTGPTFNGTAGTTSLSAFSPTSISLAPASSTTFTATYTLSQADINNAAGLTNAVSNTASAVNSLNQNAVLSGGSAPTAKSTIPNSSSLSIAKSVSSITTNNGNSATTVDAGDIITYQYSVTNTGNTTLSAVSPTDSGPTFNSNTATTTLSAFSPSSATLAPNSAQIFTASYTLAQADINNSGGVANGVSNTASATGTDPRNNTVTATAPSTATTTISVSPTLTIIKSYSLSKAPGNTNAGVAETGDEITYSYGVTNTGNVTISNVSVGDNHNGTGPFNVPTSASLTDNGTQNDSSDTNPASTIWGSLAPQDVVTFTSIYTVIQSDIDQLQ